MKFLEIFHFVSLVLATIVPINYGFSISIKNPTKTLFKNRASSFELKSGSTYSGLKEYIDYLSTMSKLPAGFKVGAARFNFEPIEVAGKTLPMNVTIIALDQPTSTFAAMFTSNKFPGGPILVGV